MLKRSSLWYLMCCVLGCAAEADANRPVQDAEPPQLLTQRVSGVVKREAATLVSIETEHEAFITTPEHPFATPHSGWIRAGQLVPGDRVVSARFGTVRVLSSRSEKPSRPVPVFNLSVDRSHAYLVGTDQVLVHNTKCQSTAELLARHNEELTQAQRALQARQRTLSTSPAQEAQLKPQILDLKRQIKNLKQSIQRARERLEKDAMTREVEALDAKIEGLKTDLTSSADKPAIQKRIDELAEERGKLKKRLD